MADVSMTTLPTEPEFAMIAFVVVMTLLAHRLNTLGDVYGHFCRRLFMKNESDS